MDIVLDAVTVLDRAGGHTGIINTQGGDAYELATAGHGGKVALSEDSAAVEAELGAAEFALAADNIPLIVAAGTTLNITETGAHDYTDVIVAGTLNIQGDIELRASGTFYLAPNGKIVARNGSDGADVSIYSRGMPLLQGLLDARGEDGKSGQPNGGNGGAVSFVYAAPGVLLAPTVITRGGDADRADVSAPGGGPGGGDGGHVDIATVDSHVFLGGGIGPVIGSVTVPAWRSGTIDSALLDPPGRWAGDYLPPPPPFTRSSIGVASPAADERVRLWTAATQVGFLRGVLTTGGMGGTGVGSSDTNKHGGRAGVGGNINIALGPFGLLTSRDIDLVTGAEVETLTHRFYLPPPLASTQRLVCTSSGAHGGFGANHGGSGGNGGAGGAAGTIIISGGSLAPAPSTFVQRHEIKGFPAGQRLQDADDGCSRGSLVIGKVLEARDANAHPLYRVRLTAGGNALLGGLGGIPSGRSSAGYSGDVGAYGTSAPITGLPVQ